MINFFRPVGIALALVVMLLNAAIVDAAGANPLVVAFEEESIPAADLASPSPAASPNPAASPSPADDDSNPDSDTWEKVPTSPSAPAAQVSPGEFKAVSAAPAAPPAVPQAAPS